MTDEVKKSEAPKATQEFDYRSSIVDPKTGKVVKDQPFKMYVSREHGEIMERPEGQFWYPNGTPAFDPRPKRHEEKKLDQEKKSDAAVSKK